MLCFPQCHHRRAAASSDSASSDGTEAGGKGGGGGGGVMRRVRLQTQALLRPLLVVSHRAGSSPRLKSWHNPFLRVCLSLLVSVSVWGGQGFLPEAVHLLLRGMSLSTFRFFSPPLPLVPCPALPCPAGLLVPTYSLSKEGGAGGHVVQSPTTPDQNESGRRRGVANGHHRLGAAAAAPFGEKRGAARSRTKRPACHGVNADNPVRAVSRAGGVD